MNPEISVKNTKNEILDAYHDVLQEMKELKKQGKPELKKEQDKQMVIKQASENTTEQVVANLSSLKLSMTKVLEELEGKLLNEQKRLSQLNQAITFQQHELEQLYEIKATTDTLAALLQTQKLKKEYFEKEMAEQRTAFEQEMQQKRATLKREQEEALAAWKEQEALHKKARQREEEDYHYKRDFERQKEQDYYLTQKQQLEKELVDKKLHFEKTMAEREAAVLANEQELQSLRTQAEAFPQRLQAAIEQTEKTLTERLQFKYDYEAKLTQKEVEGEKRLHQQMITALESKLVQQDQQIKALIEKADHAGKQVQAIAVKAIEGASSRPGVYYASSSAEKPADAAKG